MYLCTVTGWSKFAGTHVDVRTQNGGAAASRTAVQSNPELAHADDAPDAPIRALDTPPCAGASRPVAGERYGEIHWSFH
jgi:hypothetical protein